MKRIIRSYWRVCSQRQLEIRMRHAYRADRKRRDRCGAGGLGDEPPPERTGRRTCGARAWAGRRTLAQRALGLVVFPIAELEHESSGLVSHGGRSSGRPRRLFSAARGHALHRALRGESRRTDTHPMRGAVAQAQAGGAKTVRADPGHPLRGNNVVVATGPYQVPRSTLPLGRACSSCMQPSIAIRCSCPPAPYWWSAPGIRACRSPRSCVVRNAGCSFRSVRTNGSSVAIGARIAYGG